MNKLVLSLASIVLVILGFYFGQVLYKSKPAADASVDIQLSELSLGKEGNNRQAMFMGIREPNSDELIELYPALSNKPLLVSFTSKYCLDCKKMKPIVADIISSRNDFEFKMYDIIEDAKAFPKEFRVFAPVSVPTLVFVNQDGSIETVLYNQQPKETIETTLNQLTDKAKALESGQKVGAS